jgi:hypothetical protein
MAGPAMREVLAKFGVEIDAGKLNEFDGKLRATVGSLRGVVDAVKVTGGVLLAGAFAAGLTNLVHQFTEAADQIDDTAEFLGMSREALQEWRFAASQNGLEAERLTGALQRLAASGEAADQGGKKQVAAFKKLGVAYKDGAGNVREVGDLLPAVAEGFSKLDTADRARVAIDLFGRQGMRLIPLLSQGAAGMAEYREQMEALGGGFTDKAVKDAGAYRDALARLDFAWTSLKTKAIGPLLPVLETAIDWFSRGVGWVSRLGERIAWVAKQTNLLEAASITLGIKAIPVFAQWATRTLPTLMRSLRALPGAIRALWPVIAPIVVPIAKFIALSLVIDEVVTAFRGGRTVVEDFVDSVFGIGATQEFLDAFRAVWDDVTDGITLAIAAVKDLWGALSGGGTSNLDKAMNSFKGSNIGAALTGERSLMQSGQKRRDDKREDALRTGDVKGFVEQRAKGETREQALDRFKAERKELVHTGQVAMNDKDRSLFDARELKLLDRTNARTERKQKAAVIPERGPASKIGTTVQQTQNLTINAHGAGPDLVRKIREEVKAANEKSARDLKVALAGGGG